MQNKVLVLNVGVLLDVINPLGVKQGGSALDAMYLITFFQEEFGEIGAILASDAGD
jgi:hypothetical protein